MGIVVQTNVTSLIAQNNLTTATKKMDTAMERMTTGYKINSAKDDAAGLYVATSLDKNIRGSEVAQKNVQMGNDMISTAEEESRYVDVMGGINYRASAPMPRTEGSLEIIQIGYTYFGP